MICLCVWVMSDWSTAKSLCEQTVSTSYIVIVDTPLPAHAPPPYPQQLTAASTQWLTIVTLNGGDVYMSQTIWLLKLHYCYACAPNSTILPMTSSQEIKWLHHTSAGNASIIRESNITRQVSGLTSRECDAIRPELKCCFVSDVAGYFVVERPTRRNLRG